MRLKIAIVNYIKNYYITLRMPVWEIGKFRSGCKKSNRSNTNDIT